MFWKRNKDNSKCDRAEIKRGKLLSGVTIGTSAYSFLRGQLNWLSKQGWEPVLVSTPDRMAELASTREEVPLVGIAMERGISPIKDFIALAKWIKLISIEKPIAVSVGTPKAGFLGILSAWIMRVPKRLYVLRGLRLEGAPRSLSWVLWTMEWLTMALATDIFCVSPSLEKECKRRSLHFDKKIWLIGEGSSNGVDSKALETVIADVNREDLRKRLGIEESDFIVGFVGRINSDKGVDQILEALASPRLNSAVKVLAIGDIEDKFIMKLAQQLGNKFVGIGWQDDVWSYFPAMDVLCLPTKREGFPNVVLEAAVAGVPAITTFSTGAIDSVVPGVTGLLFQFGDVEGLIASINELADDPDKLHSLGAAAKRRAINEFIPKDIWTGLDEILTDEKFKAKARKPLKFK